MTEFFDFANESWKVPPILGIISPAKARQIKPEYGLFELVLIPGLRSQPRSLS